MKLKITVTGIFLLVVIIITLFVILTATKEMKTQLKARTGYVEYYTVADTNYQRYVARPANSEWITTQGWHLSMQGDYFLVPEDEIIEAKMIKMLRDAKSSGDKITLLGHGTCVEDIGVVDFEPFYTLRIVYDGDSLDMFTYIPDIF